jgi:F-type H+-transporting ATPase subunit delta
MGVYQIARRYAGALVDVVEKSGEAQAVRTELKVWEDLISGGSDLKGLDNPTIDHKLKQGVLEQLIGRTRPTRTTANFLRVLVKNRRLRYLPEINAQFDKELDERSGSVHVTITSARELSEGERSELIRNLASVTGMQVRPEYEVEPGLIGGVVAQIGWTVYDGSVRTKLRSLREQLVNG